MDKLWELPADDERRKFVYGNLYGLMMGVLKPLAQFFVQQPVGPKEKGKVAAPTFEYYRFNLAPGAKSTLAQLQDEMQAALNSYIDIKVPDETEDQVTIHNYGAQIDLLLPIQNAINSLLDLEHFVKIAQPVIKKVTPGVQSSGAKGFAKGK
jgi:hypothetical protein